MYKCIYSINARMFMYVIQVHPAPYLWYAEPAPDKPCRGVNALLRVDLERLARRLRRHGDTFTGVPRP